MQTHRFFGLHGGTQLDTILLADTRIQWRLNNPAGVLSSIDISLNLQSRENPKSPRGSAAQLGALGRSDLHVALLFSNRLVGEMYA